MERTYINEFHKQWIESTLKSITSWQKQPISLEEKEATGNAEPPEGYKRGQILFLYLTSIKAGRMKFSPVMKILYSN